MSTAKNSSCQNNKLKQTGFIDLNSSNLSKKSAKQKNKSEEFKLKSNSSASLLKKSKLSTSAIKSTYKQKKQKSNSKHKSSLSEDGNNAKKIDLQTYNCKVRKNNKKFLSREDSSENLNMRLPWGVNGPRLNNYVLQTLAKMNKLRKSQNSKKQNIFNTQRSQILKQSQIKYVQLTPKKSIHEQHSQNKKKTTKLPQTEQKTEKTNKKVGNKNNKNTSSSKQTQKQQKHTESVNDEFDRQKIKKIPNLISNSFSGQFQCLQRNNLYVVNYRIVKRRIIEIEVAILKKIQSLTVNLSKGSVQCQSINQSYDNVISKSSLILMSAVTGINKHEKFSYPELHIVLNQKNGTFGFQKKITIPYNWVYLIDILPTGQLKDIKFGNKIKNKSIIQQIGYRKQLLMKLDKIFQNNFVRSVSKNKEQVLFMFGFVYLGEPNILRLIINGNNCSLQCECNPGGHAQDVLEMFANILGI